MAVAVTTHRNLVPVITSSLAQLAPAMAETQEKMQVLVDTTSEALTRAEERNTKLEEELIASKAQHAADKAAAEAQAKAMQQMLQTLQTNFAALTMRVSQLEEERTKYLRPAIKTLVIHHGHVDLDYPGKGGDLAVRLPELAKEIDDLETLRAETLRRGGLARVRIQGIDSKLGNKQAELARIVAYQEKERAEGSGGGGGCVIQ